MEAATDQVDAKVQGRNNYTLTQTINPPKGIDVNACRAVARAGIYPGSQRVWTTRGGLGWMCLAVYTGFSTINAPNQASCTPTNGELSGTGEADGLYTAGSYHYGARMLCCSMVV